MASTCFGHLHVHLQEFLYVVSLPHAVLCHRCWGCGPAELVCSLVHCLSVSILIYIWCTVTLISNRLVIPWHLALQLRKKL